MSTVTFSSGDAPFIAWMQKNPDGFVLNTTPSEATSYLKFHRANCHHISGYTTAQSAGAFTTRGYIKVCSNSAAELVAWAAKNRPSTSTYESCKTCAPDIENIAPLLAEEAETEKTHVEGAVRTITVNAYERNPLAREACLAHYGYSCFACGFNFEAKFGPLGRGFIHVHHLVPLSEIATEYKVDPIKDLRPLCPNCHAAIHLGNRTRSIEDLIEALTHGSLLA